MPTQLNQLFLRAAAVSVVLSLGTAGPAYAYIDPNTGGYVFQVLFPLISAIAGIFIFFKKQTSLLITKILDIFKRK